MAGERWQRLEALFEEAAARPAAERTRFLVRACGDDLELKAELRSLLAADGAAGSFLEQPALVPIAAEPAVSWAGRRLGPYRLERQLGEGGMSTVYLAVRADEAYERQVAVKVFRYGADRSDLLDRFRAERQILASLDHPAIARLVDGGSTDQGLPYLVMEYIDGEPIDRYCDRRRMSIDARIDLFREVAAAVQFAHQNLVVHRDIKPSNLLVSGDGAPHLLDFGIAKLLAGAAVPHGPGATLTGQRLMTPHYASPEQVDGRPITTASDVYSLGVLLYVLLTGQLPYRARADRLGAIEQAVLEEEPERPSTAAGRATASRVDPPSAEPGAEPPPATLTASEARATRPPLLARKLAGDLDNIVLLALRKEPRERYASVELFSEDLRRYRSGLPVLARRSTLRYRLGKFVGRHRLGIAAAAALAVLIVGLAVAMTAQALSLARQRDEIRRERDKALAVTRFLEGIFEVASPDEARGETITAREILDQGAARIEAGLQHTPEAQATLALAIGKVYRRLGLYGRARPILERSLALRRDLLGAAHPAVAESLDAVATLAAARGDLESAERFYREALAMRRTLLPAGDPAVAESLNGLATVLIARADLAAAEPLLREALAINRRRFGEEHEEVATNLGNLGFLTKERGDAAAAEELYRQALAIWRRLYGEAHPQIATQLNNLAVLVQGRGDLAAAEDLYRQALAVARKVWAEEHPEIALQLNNLAAILTLKGDLAAAEPLTREALAMRRRLLGDDHEQVAMSLNNLGRLLEEMGKLDGVRPLYEEALRIQRRALGEEHPRVGTQLANLASLLVDQGDPGAAEPFAREALRIRRLKLGDAHPDVGASLVVLGRVFLARGDAAGAEPHLSQGLAVLTAALGTDHWRTAEAQTQLGACLGMLGRRTEAEPLLTAAYQTLVRLRGATHPRTERARGRLVAFYEAGGEPAKGAALLARPPG
jgi:serine/threonine-protein kinase